jgi:putative sigma-54 modulation protein
MISKKGGNTMKISVVGKNIQITDAIREKIESKFDRLRNFASPDTIVKVAVSARKENQKIEVTIIEPHGPVIRSEETKEDLYSAIDLVTDKIKKQLNKHKKRVQDKNTHGDSIRFFETESKILDSIDFDEELEENDEYEVVIERRKRFTMKPMSEKEAVLQMDLLGHNFFLFRNLDTDEVALVYKRKDGGYGIIEQEE